MSISLTFVYEAEVYTGQGDRVDRTYVETFPIPVPEIASSECARVMRHKGFVGSLHSDRVPVDILLHDGAVYEPLMTSGYVGSDFKTVTLGVASDVSDLERRIQNLYAFKFPLAGADKVKLKGPPRADRVIESKRDKAIEAMEKIAADVVSIGGQIHIRVAEPVLVAGEHYVSLVNGVDAVAAESRPHLFRVDQIEEATARAMLLGGHSDQSAIKLPDYELFETDWLRYAPSPLDASIALRAFESDVALYVDRLPVAAIIAYGRFRDGMRYATGNYYRPPDAEVVTMDEALERARQLAAEIPEGMLTTERAVAIDILDRIQYAQPEMGSDESIDLFITDSASLRY